MQSLNFQIHQRASTAACSSAAPFPPWMWPIFEDHQMRLYLSCVLVSAVMLSPAYAGDQTRPGSGNAESMKLASASPLVQSAFNLLRDRLSEAKDVRLRDAMGELMDHRSACIRHRAGLNAEKKQAILDRLDAAGLIDKAEATRIPQGGLLAGIFPPVESDGSPCPKMPQAFWSAPGGATFGHHSEPGGLPVHEAFNDSSALALADNYRVIYGNDGPDGLPVVVRDRGGRPNLPAAFTIDPDEVLIAPMWHDWAKTMVFQWNADGTEFVELNFGGNGKTDDNGRAGDSKTGAHHILGLAEAIKRGLPPDFVAMVASAHSVPTYGSEYKVVNWIRAAAVIAEVDPFQTGYLKRDAKGQPRLPAVRRLGELDLNGAPVSQTNVLIEWVLHNLSDADFVFTGPAATDVSLVLEKLAPEYGVDPKGPDYLIKFRNPVLTYLSAERLFVLFSNGGLDAVRADISKLVKARKL